MPTTFSVVVENQITSDLMDRLNTAVGTAGTLRFFQGTEPANCEAADAGTQLISIPCNNPAFSGPSDNQFSLNSVAVTAVAVAGTAQYWRIKHSSGTTIMQGNCGLSGGVAITFNDVTWTTSDDVALDFFGVILQLFGVDV